MQREPIDPVAERAVLERQELTLTAARTLLDHHRVGRICDPESIKWAHAIVDAHEGRRPQCPAA